MKKMPNNHEPTPEELVEFEQRLATVDELRVALCDLGCRHNLPRAIQLLPPHLAEIARSMTTANGTNEYRRRNGLPRLERECP